MNAYELADELQELDSKLHLINLFKSANMLRQQADRIAELEKDLHMVQRHYDQQQTKPRLSDEEIEDIESRVYAKTISKGKPMGIYAKTLCRAIEERILGK